MHIIARNIYIRNTKMTVKKRLKKDPTELSHALKANLLRRKNSKSKEINPNFSNQIVILGSSNSSGKTKEAVSSLVNKKTTIIDLQTLNISYYDYANKNSNDDYLPLIEKSLEHDLIILATPVYWYSMCAQMKTFIDRISDLTSIRKDLGRKLRGKKLFVIASFDTSLPKSFEAPFSQTCEYLGIKYEGCSFIYGGNDIELIKNNVFEIEKAKRVIEN